MIPLKYIAYALLIFTGLAVDYFNFTRHHSLRADKTCVKPINMLLGAVTSGHSMAFGKENLLTQRILHQEQEKWNQAVDAACAFIKNNDSQLSKDVDTLWEINNTFLTTLNTTYAKKIENYIYKPHATKGVELNAQWTRHTWLYAFELRKAREQIDWNNINYFMIGMSVGNLRKHHAVLEKLLASLQIRHLAKNGTPPTNEQEEALRVFVHLATALGETIKKAIDLDWHALQQAVEYFRTNNRTH